MMSDFCLRGIGDWDFKDTGRQNRETEYVSTVNSI